MLAPYLELYLYDDLYYFSWTKARPPENEYAL
jgi:hypothetical protein